MMIIRKLISRCLVGSMFLAVICVSAVFAGKNSDKGIWTKSSISLSIKKNSAQTLPNKYLVYKLDRTLLSRVQGNAPIEFSENSSEKTAILEIPMPDGSISRFRIEESKLLASHISAAFPEWKTYNGYGIDDPSATARFDWTAKGFHGYILSPKGTVYIDPVQEGNTEDYLVFYKHEYGSDRGDFSCKYGSTDLVGKGNQISYFGNMFSSFSNGTSVRQFRIAIATTGEWSRSRSVSADPITIRNDALASITTSINRLDGIFRRELGVSFALVNPATNSAQNIIFDDPATDPYDNTDNAAQLTINQTTITTNVGVGNYDVGHLFGTGGGGIAATPSVCDATAKAQGYSARDTMVGDPFVVDYVAHEIGHQFGANHTYNNSDPGGSCTTRNAATAFEVASGSSLMSYVGICSARNLQQYVDTGTPAFHIGSLTEAVTHLQDAGGGGSCGLPIGVANTIPTVNAGVNVTIPALTPFTLTATANDPDPGAALLYSWEQFDVSTASGASGTPVNTYDVDSDGVLRPLFRAYSPVSSPSRTFPSLTFILNNNNTPPLDYMGTHPTGLPGAVCEVAVTCVVGENQTTQNRTMNFRVSVRDSQGGTADAGMTVTSVNTGAPFKVTAQDSLLAPNWQAGTMQTVTWNVSGTAAAPVNAANVNILLSTDGGQTFPITLVANTPNDGTQGITVPNNPTTTARLKVEAVGNIFFDISNVNFTITAPTAANVSVSGRVLASNGRGISRANVQIADQFGNIRTAISNSFGYYRFEGIEAGQSYVFTVFAKQYQFDSQVVSIEDNISSLNFIANQ